MGDAFSAVKREDELGTHVWPEWLKTILPNSTHRVVSDENVVDLGPDRQDIVRASRIYQGGLFSQKQFLACDKCNTGWMRDFEEEVLLFARPLSAGVNKISLTRMQTYSLSKWICLITMLVDYSKAREKFTIPKAGRRYLMQHLEPHDHWSVFICSLDSTKWNINYQVSRQWYDSTIPFLNSYPLSC